MTKHLPLIIVLLLTFCTTSFAKKKLYRWVDENGKVTYSDQVPPDQIKKKHQEMSSTGVVVEKVDRIQTDEERKAAREELLRQKALEKQAEEDAKRRKNIILAYNNEKEILRLKEERLESLKRNIEQAEKSLVFQNKSREELLSRAADSERNGRKVSKALLSNIKVVEEKIKNQNIFIKNKTAEIIVVTEKFDKDLEIYRKAKRGIEEQKK